VKTTLEIPDPLFRRAKSAAVRDELKRRARPIPSNDLWIAALARQHRLPV
jgi:predicted nucleic acid-binding protein